EFLVRHAAHLRLPAADRTIERCTIIAADELVLVEAPHQRGDLQTALHGLELEAKPVTDLSAGCLLRQRIGQGLEVVREQIHVEWIARITRVLVTLAVDRLFDGYGGEAGHVPAVVP